MSSQCTRCSNNLCAKKVPIFKTLDDKQIVDIIKMTGHKEFKKGEILCNEGEITSSLFIINEGKVKLSKINKEGKEQILRILSNGSFFGEYYLLSDYEAYNFSAYAITDVKICTLAKKDLDIIIKNNPEIAIRILGEVSKRLTNTENLVQSLSTNDTESRIAYVLLDLADKYGITIEQGIEITMPITREEMSKYAGVTRETISRKLHKFADENLITLEGNKIIIINNFETLKEYI